ncbi:MAG: 3-dehydroquinate synthase [Gemmatimonadetes bacterium]|nr:3-dehydroquinate synthase [Gemmatimonadota bacterium]
MTEPAVLEITTPGGGGYPIHIEPGALRRLPDRCGTYAPAHRYAVISDSQVARLCGPQVIASLADAGLAAELIEFPAGEWNKTREQWYALSDALLARGFGRDTAVVALGGGVTGDLAGFVAATYMRGVPVVQVPTTLLAMLDSSVGGKTGVDTDAGKNLVGAFHHPAAVVVDPLVLSTLPRHQRCAGLAEAVKTAAIRDDDLFGWMTASAEPLVSGDADAVGELVHRVVRHKAAVVREDPAERGVRAILNFGHTVGHALETLEGYTLLHGEAVAAGMRVEARLGEALEITEPGTAARLAALLAACRLDGEWEGSPRPDAVVEAMSHDKKARGSDVRCVLLSRIGEVARDPDGCHTFALTEAELGPLLAAALRPDSDA